MKNDILDYIKTIKLSFEEFTFLLDYDETVEEITSEKMITNLLDNLRCGELVYYLVESGKDIAFNYLKSAYHISKEISKYIDYEKLWADMLKSGAFYECKRGIIEDNR